MARRSEHSRHSRHSRKLPFDIHAVVRQVRSAVENHADAAMFELRGRGFGTPFQQLVACILSIRTRDEVSLPAALALLERAPDARAMSRLGVRDVDQLIQTCTFHEAKARQIHEMALRVVEELGGEMPCDADVMMSFRGVGPKCANLALGIACGQERISVDVHVERVTNRWGYVATRSPDATRLALEQVLPCEYWIEINRLLVPFGKHVCTGRLPKCSTCPVLAYCRQVGVERHR